MVKEILSVDMLAVGTNDFVRGSYRSAVPPASTPPAISTLPSGSRADDPELRLVLITSFTGTHRGPPAARAEARPVRLLTPTITLSADPMVRIPRTRDTRLNPPASLRQLKVALLCELRSEPFRAGFPLLLADNPSYPSRSTSALLLMSPPMLHAPVPWMMHTAWSTPSFSWYQVFQNAACSV